MGVIPLQASHSGRTSDHCRLCAAAAERDQATTTTSRKLVEVIPLGLAACLGLFLAAIDGGVVGAVGAGVAAGVATASLYLRARRRSFRHEAEDAHASKFQDAVSVETLELQNVKVILSTPPNVALQWKQKAAAATAAA